MLLHRYVIGIALWQLLQCSNPHPLLPLPFHAGQYLATPVKAAEDICLSVRAPPQLANSQNILLSSGLSTQALLWIGCTSAENFSNTASHSKNSRHQPNSASTSRCVSFKIRKLSSVEGKVSCIVALTMNCELTRERQDCRVLIRGKDTITIQIQIQIQIQILWTAN